jgi:hypothetical protein
VIRNQFSPEPTWPKKAIVELLRASKRAAYWVTSQLPLCCPATRGRLTKGEIKYDKQPPAHFSLSDNPVQCHFQSIRRLIRYPNTRNF